VHTGSDVPPIWASDSCCPGKMGEDRQNGCMVHPDRARYTPATDVLERVFAIQRGMSSAGGCRRRGHSWQNGVYRLLHSGKSKRLERTPT
jgi:hypothetical protein